jgi:pyruvate/2-oxoglutarate dehydrogenase complex dihydrolipoamide dehydrogenase (E3) component
VRRHRRPGRSCRLRGDPARRVLRSRDRRGRLTEHQAGEQGIEIATATVQLADAIARPWTYEKDPRGELGIIADRERGTMIGAWAVSPLAGEWIHYAALAIKTHTPLEILRDTVAQFPTYTEAYLKAIEQLADA